MGEVVSRKTAGAPVVGESGRVEVRQVDQRARGAWIARRYFQSIGLPPVSTRDRGVAEAGIQLRAGQPGHAVFVSVQQRAPRPASESPAVSGERFFPAVIGLKPLGSRKRESGAGARQCLGMANCQ